MGKLDVQNLRYLTRDDFRVLTAIELGMRNHELVPTELIAAIAALKGGGTLKVLGTLLRNKLIAHERQQYDGFRLTYAGYDYLALKTLVARGVVAGVGRQIGVGKESDIFVVVDDEGVERALKLQRLGRTSFRAIKRTRDYLQHRRSASWLYMSRLGALKEFAFMSALHDAGFPTPVPIECNRHAVLMSLVPGRPLAHARELPDVAATFAAVMALAARLAGAGLVHCDLNEFNVMLSPDGTDVTLIDFPQMVSTTHENARELFERDVRCLRVFFERRFGYAEGAYPTWAAVAADAGGGGGLDVAVEASGFITAAQLGELDTMLAAERAAAAGGGGDDNDEEDEEEEGEGEVEGDGGADGDDSGGADAAAGAGGAAADARAAATRVPVVVAIAVDVDGGDDAAAVGGDVGGGGGEGGGGGPLSTAAARRARLVAVEAEERALEARFHALSTAPALVAAGGADAAAATAAADAPAVVAARGVRFAADTVGSGDGAKQAGAVPAGGSDSGSDDDAEGSGDSDGSVSDDPAAAARRAAAARTSATALFERPPGGTRTRPGGGRVRMSRRGEAYLEDKGGAGGEGVGVDAAAARGGGVDGRSVGSGGGASALVSADEVKRRVRKAREKAQRRQELQAAASARARGSMKERGKVHASRLAKSGSLEDDHW